MDCCASHPPDPKGVLVTDSMIHSGALVRDRHARVGKVVGDPVCVELDGNTVEVFNVDFWGNEYKRPEAWLAVLPSDSPEALLWERPEELASWAEEAPLRLVALALSVGGGSGKVADIRAKLDERVLEAGKWENWWKKQPQQMRRSSACFKVTKVGRDSEYSLLTSFDAVPAVGEVRSSPKPAKSVGSADRGAATLANWEKWLESGSHDTIPGRFPTKPTIDSLAEWPARTIEPSLLRLITSAERLSSAGSMSAQAAEGWLRAIAQAALRWRETGGQDTRGYLAARAGEALARLARTAGDRTPQDLLLQTGAMDGAADAWRRGFAAGMWDAFDGEDARDLYHRSAELLGRQARGDLAREMVLAAFGPDFSARRHSELDRLLDALPEEQRERLLQEVIASATADQRNGVLFYIAESRHSSGPEHLGLRLVASLALGDEQGELAMQTSRELAQALDEPYRLGKPVEAAFSAVVSKISAAGLSATAEVQKRSAEAQALLEQERQEQERLRQQVRERNADLAAGREESRLEARRDMLLAVGEVLQSLHGMDSAEAVVGKVSAGLELALRAGGAELLGTAPNGFNPRLHESTEMLQESTPIKVIAPGVVVRGGTHGDLVLLKAQVSREAF